MTHYDTYVELRPLAAAEGALGLESHRRRRVVVGPQETSHYEVFLHFADVTFLQS